MAITIQDLLTELDRELAAKTANADSANCAVAALGPLGRALVLASDEFGYEGKPADHRRRGSASLLGESAAMAAEQWAPADGRLVDLAGALADTVGRQHLHVDSDQGWAVAAGLSDAAKSCVRLARRFEPYRDLEVLARVERLADWLHGLSRRDAPNVADRAILDAPLLSHAITEGSGRPPDVGTAGGLVAALHGELRQESLNLTSLVAACIAAQSATELATRVAAALNTNSDQPGMRAPHSWTTLQGALARFRSPVGTSAVPSPVIEWAMELQRALERPPRDRDEFVTAIRHAANRMPAIAAAASFAVARWSEGRWLMAPARSLPRSGDHVSAVVRNEYVIANPTDVVPVLVAARIAERLSAELALELDYTAGDIGRQPHPHLLAAFAAQRPEPARLRSDGAWAHRLALRCTGLDTVQPTIGL